MYRATTESVNQSKHSSLQISKCHSTRNEKKKNLHKNNAPYLPSCSFVQSGPPVPVCPFHSPLWACPVQGRRANQPLCHTHCSSRTWTELRKGWFNSATRSAQRRIGVHLQQTVTHVCETIHSNHSCMVDYNNINRDTIALPPRQAFCVPPPSNRVRQWPPFLPKAWTI